MPSPDQLKAIRYLIEDPKSVLGFTPNQSELEMFLKTSYGVNLRDAAQLLAAEGAAPSTYPFTAGGPGGAALKTGFTPGGSGPPVQTLLSAGGAETASRTASASASTAAKGAGKKAATAALGAEYADLPGAMQFGKAAKGAGKFLGKLKGSLGLLGLVLAAYEVGDYIYGKGPGARKDERIARLLGLQGEMGNWEDQLALDREESLNRKLTGLQGVERNARASAQHIQNMNQQDLVKLIQSREDLLGQISEARGPSPMEIYLQLSH